MARKNECIAMLLAGGQGSRLGILTHKIAKPAVPFGGKYRIIDFPLSNCVNSGIYTVGVLTQYQPLELNDYVGNGEPWDLDRTDGGVHILSPYQQIQGTDWYKGTANAIYQNIHFIDKYDPEYVVVLSGDHIYKMDYADMLAFHKKQEAACTIAMREVEWKEASRFGLMLVNDDSTISEFEEKPENPRSNKASMGIYIFTWSKLREYLIADENDPASSNDFGHNVIPAMHEAGEKMVAYQFDGYWRDVGTIESLWEANMDILSPVSGINLNLCNSGLRACILNALHNLDPQFYKRENMLMAERGNAPFSQRVAGVFASRDREADFLKFIVRECRLENTDVLYRTYNIERIQNVRMLEVWQHIHIPFLNYYGEIKHDVLETVYKITG